MKTIILACGCFVASAAFAQKISEDKVPSAAVTNFKKQFAEAAKAEWEQEEADFEVNFRAGGNEFSAKYDKEGNWLETEQEIKESELPLAVKQAVAKEFAKAEIEESEKVSFPDQSSGYELEVEQGKQKFELRFSAEGKLVKKEEITGKQDKE